MMCIAFEGLLNRSFQVRCCMPFARAELRVPECQDIHFDGGAVKHVAQGVEIVECNIRAFGMHTSVRSNG